MISKDRVVYQHI